MLNIFVPVAHSGLGRGNRAFPVEEGIAPAAAYDGGLLFMARGWNFGVSRHKARMKLANRFVCVCVCVCRVSPVKGANGLHAEGYTRNMARPRSPVFGKMEVYVCMYVCMCSSHRE